MLANAGSAEYDGLLMLRESQPGAPMSSTPPDFFLASTEDTSLELPRACWSIARLATEGRDDLLLVFVDPPLNGHTYKIDRDDISVVVLAPRHMGASLFPISEWPIAVHVACPTVDHPETQDLIRQDQLVLLSWAELYRTELEANQAMRAMESASGLRAEQFVAHGVRFLGEQDGQPERALKARLIAVLHDERAIQRAYLARITHSGDPLACVGLCMRARGEVGPSALNRLGGAFAGIFAKRVAIGIILLNEAQERELVKVCKPFYASGSLK